MSSTGSEPSAPRPQLLSVATTSVDGHFGIAVAGAVDVAGVDRLRSAADAAIADAAAGLVVLDLSGCTFIDSTGVGAVLDLHARLDEDRRVLRIVRGPRAVQRVFQVIGLADVLPFADPA